MKPIKGEKEYYAWGYTGNILIEALGLPGELHDENAGDECYECLCSKCVGCYSTEAACVPCTVGMYVTGCPDYKKAEAES